MNIYIYAEEEGKKEKKRTFTRARKVKSLFVPQIHYKNTNPNNL